MLRELLAASLACAWSLFAVAALAEDDRELFSLSWTRLPSAGECISARALARGVEGHLGRRVLDAPGHADIAIEGHVARVEEGGWRATISVTDANGVVLGTRELSSLDPSCRDLDAPLTLTIALFVDPTATAPVKTESPPPATPDPVPPPGAKARPPGPAPSARPVRPKPGWRTWAQVGGGVALGVLPGAAPGFVTRIGVQAPGGWPLAFGAALWLDQEREPRPGAEPVSLSLMHAGLAVCPLAAGWPAGALRACAGADAGVVSTRGLMAGAIEARRRFALAAVARLEGALHLGSHGFFGIGAGLGVPLVRDSFEYERSGVRERVFRMAPVTGAFDLGIGFRSH